MLTALLVVSLPASVRVVRDACDALDERLLLARASRRRSRAFAASCALAAASLASLAAVSLASRMSSSSSEMSSAMVKADLAVRDDATCSMVSFDCCGESSLAKSMTGTAMRCSDLDDEIVTA